MYYYDGDIHKCNNLYSSEYCQHTLIGCRYFDLLASCHVLSKLVVEAKQGDDNHRQGKGKYGK